MTAETHPQLSQACRAAGLPLAERYPPPAVRRLLGCGATAWNRLVSRGQAPELVRVTARIAWCTADALEEYLATHTRPAG